MLKSDVRSRFILTSLGVALFLTTALATNGVSSQGVTNVNVVVTDAETGKPIYQAHLTLQFREKGGLFKRSKWISYSAKTDLHGHCKFPDVTMGPIRLIVTAPRHQTFGKPYKLKKENQVFHVRLRKPHPLL